MTKSLELAKEGIIKVSQKTAMNTFISLIAMKEGGSEAYFLIISPK